MPDPKHDPDPESEPKLPEKSDPDPESDPKQIIPDSQPCIEWLFTRKYINGERVIIYLYS